MLGHSRFVKGSPTDSPVSAGSVARGVENTQHGSNEAPSMAVRLGGGSMSQNWIECGSKTVTQSLSTGLRTKMVEKTKASVDKQLMLLSFQVTGPQKAGQKGVSSHS